jgi:GTPase
MKVVKYNSYIDISISVYTKFNTDNMESGFMIHGNIEGIRASVLNELESIYNLKLPKDSLINPELVSKLCFVTSRVEREISVAIDRKGNVKSVAIGDSTTVELPVLDIRERKLSGIRVIHTHPNGTSRLSALDISALIKLKLDCMAAVSIVDGKSVDITLGFCDVKDNLLVPSAAESMSITEAEGYNFLDRIKYIESIITSEEIEEDKTERAILVGCDSEESLEELAELAKACNVTVMEKVFQSRNKIDNAFYIGSGKAQEVSMLSQAIRANLIIFDDELAGYQVRNLEETIGVKVIDRTTLILEIFATRARSREAKIQVELAQLKYRLPRLLGLGTVLSRTGGGIGTRGPGEKKLEIDRRHIRERLYDLQSELEKIKKVREVQREKRKRDNIPRVSLAGYTNAGKSTLRNKLCEIALAKDAMVKEKVFEADMLFATLDTTTRAINLEDNRVLTLTDTVGFVRKLPHDLVEAFKSTLEEVIYSDILIHVVDASSHNMEEQILAVEEVLTELGAGNIPTILAFNKIDKLEESHLERVREYTESTENTYIDIIEISALQNLNLDVLLRTIGKHLPMKLKAVEYLIPYDEQKVVAFLHRNGKVEVEEYKDNGTYIKALVDDEAYNKTRDYMI